MSDVIDRQAAIDAISCNIIVTGKQNAELVAATIGTFVDRIKALPPAQPDVLACGEGELIAQPEIIQCKDCKHHHYDGEDIPYCDRIDYGYGWKDDDYCSMAERKTDG